MIPASLALVTLNPARQAALQAVAEVELRRENRRRLPEDNPHARAFMRLLTGESRLSSRTAQAIPGLGWDPHVKIWSLRRLEERSKSCWSAGVSTATRRCRQRCRNVCSRTWCSGMHPGRISAGNCICIKRSGVKINASAGRKFCTRVWSRRPGQS